MNSIVDGEEMKPAGLADAQEKHLSRRRLPSVAAAAALQVREMIAVHSHVLRSGSQPQEPPLFNKMSFGRRRRPCIRPARQPDSVAIQLRRELTTVPRSRSGVAGRRLAGRWEGMKIEVTAARIHGNH